MYCSGEGDGRFIKWQWACFDQPVHVQSLIKALEASAPAASREAVSEAQLRKRLRQYLPLISAAAEEVAEREGVDLLPDDDDATWLVSGHPYLGMRVATKHASKGKDVTAIGTIMRWLPAGEDAQEDPALFHMDHADEPKQQLWIRVHDPELCHNRCSHVFPSHPRILMGVLQFDVRPDHFHQLVNHHFHQP